MDISLTSSPGQIKPSSVDSDDLSPQKPAKARARNRKKEGSDDGNKRRCCDGNLPECAACASVYNTACVYDPNSDHRRKGVYKKDIDNLKTRNSTLQTLIQAILNYPEDEVPALIKQIRTCESLDTVAEAILAKEAGISGDDEDDIPSLTIETLSGQPTFETQLSGKMGRLQLEDGSVRYIGGTSNLIHLGAGSDHEEMASETEQYQQQDNPITTWTNVTSDSTLIMHLINMYFTWHYTYFTTVSKSLFYRDFSLGKPPPNTRRKTEYCTPLLVNAMLALGCHFTSWPAARADPEDSATAGDHFFREAKRLLMENDEHEKPKLTTVQALALMSVREAGCGREAKGWVYSGMSFRMACDLGLNLDSGVLSSSRDTNLDEADEDARRITFWGCFLFDKCWSNYLGRLPQLPTSIITVPKFDVFPVEESDTWSAYTDAGISQANSQASRTRAIALQISALCEISNDLMTSFYNPIDMDKPKGKSAELKKLSELHQRLEGWRRDLPKEFEPKEGGLPNMLVMHMFFQLLFIHLFRPFLKYNQTTSPLPANVSPRKLCTQAAAMISKLLRLYKRSHGLRQICNIAVYIAHSACTIHLLNLPDKNARRDIIHGVKHLEEIAEGWLCARRTLSILSVLARKWNVELPEEAAAVLARTEAKFGSYQSDASIPKSAIAQAQAPEPPQQQQVQMSVTSYPQQMHAATVGYPVVGGAAPATAGPRRVGDNRPLPPPPQSSSEFQFPRAQRHPPTNASTPSSRGQPRTSFDSTATTTAASMSPSELFGGVDQLLREGQDWWLRDQSQLAMGFDNWNMAEAGDMSWINGNGTAGSAANFVLNGVHGYGAVNGYNEEEWYQ
ncbi:Nitrogen assimilation transcription factor nit-4 [Coniosporium apollinis]|uniref:Nitrogen assimilation transcription factor nit-4 n=1 Tax=Coniosporium apollinis TaxID=61459 RepID=A0ABQ9P636_9PEZI|nr:Nitrogen assimilation transcription factor nit-4 [Coniosporium apollinis]